VVLIGNRPGLSVPESLAALAVDATPLRLQLGQDAIDSVRTHAEMLLAELTRWKERGADVKLDHRAAV
jgi:hypothetical protein